MRSLTNEALEVMTAKSEMKQALNLVCCTLSHLTQRLQARKTGTNQRPTFWAKICGHETAQILGQEMGQTWWTRTVRVQRVGQKWCPENGHKMCARILGWRMVTAIRP